MTTTVRHRVPGHHLADQVPAEPIEPTSVGTLGLMLPFVLVIAALAVAGKLDLTSAALTSPLLLLPLALYLVRRRARRTAPRATP